MVICLTWANNYTKRWGNLDNYANSYTTWTQVTKTSAVGIAIEYIYIYLSVTEDRVRKVVILELVHGLWKSGGCKNMVVAVHCEKCATIFIAENSIKVKERTLFGFTFVTINIWFSIYQNVIAFMIIIKYLWILTLFNNSNIKQYE